MVINCRGRLLDLSKPKVMGILNVNPDSFFDGGRYQDGTSMEDRIDKMVTEGVDIIDVGGMSSRPGAEIISVEKETQRIVPAVKYIARSHPETIISIDTLQSKVASAAIEHGARIINDISGGDYDIKMVDVAIQNDCPYIIMHMQGTPEDMQSNPKYDDVVLDVLKYFNAKVKVYRTRGLKDIIVDPGFGFGKSIDHNYELLKQMPVFRVTDCPILAGISRKSMIYKPLEISPDDALSATSALHMVAIQNGAKILRVHDVKEAKECIHLFELLGHKYC